MNAVHFLARHLRCDWGDLDAEDRRANDQALQQGGRIFSAYKLLSDERIWIITRADRSSTCVLTPDEFASGAVVVRTKQTHRLPRAHALHRGAHGQCVPWLDLD